MKPPTLAPGTLEQAVYTWTNMTMAGVRGQGYAAVSDGLRSYAPWLDSIDNAHFNLLDPGVPDTSAAYKAWRTLDEIGYLHADGLGIAYKKMANGGNDGMGRPRHVVHLIVGNADEMTLPLALLLAEDQWLTAGQCPVKGMTPRLPGLRLDSLSLDPERLRHDCASADPLARQVLDQLSDLGGGEVVPLGMAELALLPMIVHAALPWPCRTTLELDCFAGADGPVGYLAIGTPRSQAPAESAPGSEQQLAELAQCEIHQELSPHWQQVPPGELAWPSYRAILSGAPLPSADAPGRAGQSAADDDAAADPCLAHELLVDARQARVDGADASLGLSESEALGFLARCTNSGIPASEVLGLNRADIEEALESTASLHGYRTVHHFLRDCDHDLLLSRWRQTGLGVLGYVTLQAWPDDNYPGLDLALVPDTCPQEQLDTLIGHLLTTREGVEQQIVLLLRHGFAAQRRLREQFLTSLGEKGRSLLHPRILEGARLPPDQLREIIRDTFPEWCDYHQIRPDEAEALDGALNRRFPWIGTAREMIRHSLTGRSQT